LVLLLSSFFVARGVRAAQSSMARAQGSLLIALALGSLFILGQAYEWSTLFGLGIGLDSTFGEPFYIVTGIHGLHVLVGLAWASLVIFLGLVDGDGRHGQGVEIFGLYWHFVDIVWVVLFSVIYLL
jgi:cytochrome c oxidase subunit 3/cytochrome o ubiquinol oxidase subunit 3